MNLRARIASLARRFASLPISRITCTQPEWKLEVDCLGNLHGEIPMSMDRSFAIESLSCNAVSTKLCAYPVTLRGYKEPLTSHNHPPPATIFAGELWLSSAVLTPLLSSLLLALVSLFLLLRGDDFRDYAPSSHAAGSGHSPISTLAAAAAAGVGLASLATGSTSVSLVRVMRERQREEDELREQTTALVRHSARNGGDRDRDRNREHRDRDLDPRDAIQLATVVTTSGSKDNLASGVNSSNSATPSAPSTASASSSGSGQSATAISGYSVPNSPKAAQAAL